MASCLENMDVTEDNEVNNGSLQNACYYMITTNGDDGTQEC